VAFSAGWGFFCSSLILIFHTLFHNIIAVVWFLCLSVFVYFIHVFGGYDCAFPASCLYSLVICFCYMFITTTFIKRTFVHFERAWLAGQGRPICKRNHLCVPLYTIIEAIATLAKLISMYSGYTIYHFRSVPFCAALVTFLLSSFWFYVEISLIPSTTHYMAFLPAGLPCSCGGERKLEVECFPGFLPPLLQPTREASRWPMYDVAHPATCV
jgi:hypothetical protein